jgi:hypothetical protein
MMHLGTCSIVIALPLSFTCHLFCIARLFKFAPISEWGFSRPQSACIYLVVCTEVRSLHHCRMLAKDWLHAICSQSQGQAYSCLYVCRVTHYFWLAIVQHRVYIYIYMVWYVMFMFGYPYSCKLVYSSPHRPLFTSTCELESRVRWAR